MNKYSTAIEIVTDTEVYRPRSWQEQAEAQYFHKLLPRFLLEACPAAGKTKWALSIARRMLREKLVDRLVIVAPLRSVTRQWASEKNTGLFKLAIDGSYRTRNGYPESWNVQGVAVTYGAVFNKPQTFADHCQLRRTLVILDEIHHAAEHQGWGSALHQAFDNAPFIISLSGTPFRCEGTIPFINYAVHPETGYEVSKADFQWTYKMERLLEKPNVRAVEPTLLEGKITLIDRTTGQTTHYDISKSIDDPAIVSARLREALNPGQPYLSAMLDAAQEQLESQRRIDPRCRGLIIAYSIRHANAIAALLASKGRTFAVAAGTLKGQRRHSEAALSTFQDDPRNSAPEWLIAVKMASEGFDCDRLRILVYATNQMTEWAVVQAIGRIIRGEGTAFLFGPCEPRLNRILENIFSGDLIVKRIAPTLDDEDKDNTDEERNIDPAPRFIGQTADPTRFITLIDGGEFTQEEIAGLREAAERHGIERTGTSDLAHLYCDWAQVNTTTNDLIELNKRPDSRLAVLSLTLVVRRRVNRLVDRLVERTGRSYWAINGEIKRRWAPRAESTLPQLWEIEQWLNAKLS